MLFMTPVMNNLAIDWLMDVWTNKNYYSYVDRTYDPFSDSYMNLKIL